ncbi:MAG: hypothetical protein WEB67_00230 [Acidimicrobiia bacterium]
MTLTATRTVSQPRPVPVAWISALLLALGLGATAGGAAMIFGVGGSSMLPDEYLDAVPLIDSWVIPGIVLMVGFGIASLIVAYGVLQTPRWRWLEGIERMTGYHWSWIATIAIGVGHVIWISLEFIYIPFSWLMPTFGLVGLALALLPFSAKVRRHLRRG